MSARPRLAFIGAGRVAHALALSWHAAGWSITAIASRDVARGQALAQQVGAAFAHPGRAVEQADLVFFSVPDDVVRLLAQGLVTLDWRSKAAVHHSGALSIDALSSLAQVGAETGSLHPALPLTDYSLDANVQQARLRGAAYALEASNQALMDQLVVLVQALGGHPVLLASGQKVLYHAALVFTSNYTVTLYAVAMRLLADISVDSASSALILNGLLNGTTANLARQGLPLALSGPLVRGDVGTIAAHLQALPPDLAALYRHLAQHTLPLAQARGTPLESLLALLSQEDSS
ncbi:MAG: F420-dependent NADP oxidoreductase [Anaerolineae bacterium]|nr:F420-dependent NADP oxidoreductase [Anaerolineae bacterium]MDW8171371.1 DUF2520 domain-containing protein [Anaerolineae bacterium]